MGVASAGLNQQKKLSVTSTNYLAFKSVDSKYNHEVINHLNENNVYATQSKAKSEKK